MSAREAAAKFLLDSGGLKVNLVGEAPVEERGFCLYGLTEYLKENKVGKAIKTGLMAAVGTVMLSGALNFVEKNYQMDKIFEPPAMESVYTPPGGHDTMDKQDINDLISHKIDFKNPGDIQKAFDDLKELGVGDSDFIVDVENPQSVKLAEATIKAKFANDPGQAESVIEDLHNAVKMAQNLDSPFAAVSSGDSNFFTIKASSNNVLQDIMGPLNLDANTANHMLQSQVDHEIQHMITSKTTSQISVALATGELSQDHVDSHKFSKYLSPEMRETFKHFDFPNDLSKDDVSFYKSVQKSLQSGTQPSEGDAQRFNDIQNKMVENVSAIGDVVNKHIASAEYTQYNEMLSDTYGVLKQVQQGHTDVVDKTIEMRKMGVDINDDHIHDTRAPLKFVSDNIKPEMLKNMSPAELSDLAAKIVKGVHYGLDNTNSNSNSDTNSETLKKAVNDLKDIPLIDLISQKTNEIVVKAPNLSMLGKFRHDSYDVENNVLITRKMSM